MKVLFGKYPGPRSKKARKMVVRIDPWDTWNSDHDLARIIHPLLVKIKELKHGYPNDFCEPGDFGPNYPPEGLLGGGMEAWQKVLDKMIWSFGQICQENFEGAKQEYGDEWMSKYEEYQDRVQEGLMLFGKYFQALWD